jgi:cytochrome c2
MSKKLILPAETKICATCSFWDGERKIDPELGVVVVEESCKGECLAYSECRRGLNDESQWGNDCLWEHLAPDEDEVESMA